MAKTLYEQWKDSCKDQDTPQAEAYREAAKRIHEIEGEVEVDEGGVVSFSDDNGAYVMAWVWVNAEEIQTQCLTCDAITETSKCPTCGEPICSECESDHANEHSIQGEL